MTELFEALNSRLAQRLGLYVILMSAFVTFFTSGYQIYTEYQRDISAVEEEIIEFENAQLSRIVSNLWLLDMYELEETLNNVISLPFIEYIAIYEEGKLLKDVGKTHSEKYISRTFPLVFNQLDNQNEIGKVVIHASLEDATNNIYQRILLIVISNMVKTFIVALLILYIFYHLVAKHLIKISNYTKNLNLDNLAKIFDYDRKHRKHADELDILRDSFVSMQEHLDASKYTLKEREKEQAEILNSMLDAVISIDEKGEILSFNHAAEVLFGYTRNEVIGENIKILMPENIAEKHDGYLENYHESVISKVVGLGREVTAMHKNTTLIPLRLFVAKLPRDVLGRKRFIGTCVDLTYIKSQEEQLRRSQRMDALGKLTGGIAHDFNNLLSIVIGYSDLLKNTLKNSSSQLNYVNEISYAGKRGVKLTNKLMSFSKENSHDSTKIDINALIKGQKDMLEKIIAVKSTLKIRLQKHLWFVFLDGSDLEDTIINLSINAMHAMQGMRDGARINITTSNQKLDSEQASLLNLEKGDYVKLTISDTGKGMDAATKEKIFDPFFTTKGAKGTGLGLTQVFGFVKRSSGVISVSSKLNEGTEFDLYFPRYKHSLAITQNTTKRSNNIIAGNETILVVDDELSLRELTREFLVQQGYNVICATSGKQALKKLEEHSIDLLLSDVIMPEMDGYQLAFKVQKKYPNVKIQLVSGFNDKRHLNINNNDGIYKRLLRKPYDLHFLLHRLRDLLDGKEVEESASSVALIRTVDNKIQPVTWEERFSTGNQNIDKDHKEFLILINLCIDGINGNQDKSKLTYILNELLTKSEQHFQIEEQILEQNGYPLLERHKKVHQLYIDCIKKYHKEHLIGGLSIHSLLYFLTDWLEEHVMGMDKLAQEYIDEL